MAPEFLFFLGRSFPSFSRSEERMYLGSTYVRRALAPKTLRHFPVRVYKAVCACCFFSSAFITNNNHIKCVLQLSAVFATTSLGPAAAPTSPTLWTLLQEKTGALASPLTMPRSTVTHQEQVPGLPKLRHQNRRCSIC